jgi:hypothetical protein
MHIRREGNRRTQLAPSDVTFKSRNMFAVSTAISRARIVARRKVSGVGRLANAPGKLRNKRFLTI